MGTPLFACDTYIHIFVDTIHDIIGRNQRVLWWRVRGVKKDV